MKPPVPRVTVIVAAAGEARRFGSPKLLAPLHGEPLIRHTLKAVLAVTEDVIVVLGHHAAGVREAVEGLPVRLATNPDPSRGMGSSIAAGARALPADANATIIVLADQPALPPSLLPRLIGAWRESGKAIVVPEFRGQQMPPVLFDASVFAELREADGERGARMIVEREPARVEVVRIDQQAPLDVDSPGDLEDVGRRSKAGGDWD